MLKVELISYTKNKINQDQFAVVTEFHHRFYKFLFLGLCIYKETHFYGFVPPCLSRQNSMQRNVQSIKYFSEVSRTAMDMADVCILLCVKLKAPFQRPIYWQSLIGSDLKVLLSACQRLMMMAFFCLMIFSILLQTFKSTSFEKRNRFALLSSIAVKLPFVHNLSD